MAMNASSAVSVPSWPMGGLLEEKQKLLKQIEAGGIEPLI
jgi:hypothetical protein